jgi:hypothetical protein
MRVAGVVGAVLWAACLVDPCAADDHAWIQRLEAEASRVEEALAKLDGKEPSRGVVFARVKALDARVGALETAAGVAPGAVSGKDELRALTQDLVTLAARVRRLAYPEVKKDVDQATLVPKRRAFRHGFGVHAVYDGPRHATTVEADVPLGVPKGTLPLALAVSYTMPGDEPSVPSHVVVALRAHGEGGRYLAHHPLTAWVVARWRRAVPTTDFLRLVQRKEVAATIGGTDVRLPADGLEALRDAASRMGPK